MYKLKCTCPINSLVFTAKATNEGSGEAAHARRLTRAFTARTYDLCKNKILSLCTGHIGGLENA